MVAVPQGTTATAPASQNQGMNAMAEAMSNDPDQTVLLGLMQKLQNNPNDPETLLELSDLFMRRGDLDQAENFINRAAVASPSDARPPFYLGVLLERRGDYVKAASSLERALGMEGIPEARFSLAILLIYRLDDQGCGQSSTGDASCLSGPERRSEGSCRNGAEKAVNAPIPFEDTLRPSHPHRAPEESASSAFPGRGQKSCSNGCSDPLHRNSGALFPA